MHHSRDHCIGCTTPAHARIARSRAKVCRFPIILEAARNEQTAARWVLAEMPSRRFRFPRSLPAESVSEYQPAGAAHGHVLHHRLKSKLLGRFAAFIAPCEPEVAPNNLRA